MAKRNKANGKHTLQSVRAKVENMPSVNFKTEFGEKLLGIAKAVIVDNDHVIKVSIMVRGDNNPYWVPVNRIQW